MDIETSDVFGEVDCCLHALQTRQRPLDNNYKLYLYVCVRVHFVVSDTARSHYFTFYNISDARW